MTANYTRLFHTETTILHTHPNISNAVAQISISHTYRRHLDSHLDQQIYSAVCSTFFLALFLCSSVPSLHICPLKEGIRMLMNFKCLIEQTEKPLFFKGTPSAQWLFLKPVAIYDFTLTQFLFHFSHNLCKFLLTRGRKYFKWSFYVFYNPITWEPKQTLCCSVCLCGKKHTVIQMIQGQCIASEHACIFLVVTNPSSQGGDKGTFKWH